MKDINPDIQILGEYVTAHAKIKFKCLNCGLIHSTQAVHLINGVGCPRCSNRMTLTQDVFERKVKEKNPNIVILSKYVNNKSIIKYKCRNCGYESETMAKRLLGGHGCAKCGGTLKETNVGFKERMKQVHPDIEVLSEYKNNKTKIHCKCTICNKEWYARADHLLSGSGCPVCCLPRGEKDICNILMRHKIKYEQQKEYCGLIGLGGGNLSYDFYLPDYNLLIEYQGVQHDKPVSFFGGKEKFELQQEYDRRKKEYAQAHNIQLLEIWYNENIEQKLKETLNLETVETTGH